jgi:hypothetical protein
VAITIGIIALVVICIALASTGHSSGGRCRRKGSSGFTDRGSSGFLWFGGGGDGGSGSDCGGGFDGGGGGGSC